MLREYIMCMNALKSVIRIPGFSKVNTYDCLEEMIAQVSHSYLDNRIVEVITYNAVYRRAYLSSGWEGLMKKLILEVPSLAEEEGVLNSVKAKLAAKGMGDYNIACYQTNEPIELMGHRFLGLGDIVDSVTCNLWMPKEKTCTDKDICAVNSPKKGVEGLEILKIYKKYPCFDSYDSFNENRYYQNFVFSRKKFMAEKVNRIIQLPTGCNDNLCTESIPGDLLPIIYYSGEGEVLIVASPW